MIETREEFAQAYARRSGVTVEWLLERGREVRPCDCGEDMCEGWQMAYVKEPSYRVGRRDLPRL